MNSSNQEREEKKKINQVQTFPVPIALEEKQENFIFKTKTTPKPSKEQIINQAIQFHLKGNIPEAAKLYEHFINQGFKDHRVFSNYGIVLKNLGNLKAAELSTRKAIELKPDFTKAHFNLGIILSNLDKLKEAEKSYRKAIKLNPNLSEAHCNLGKLLIDLGNLKAAELSTRKAIELNPDFAEAHSNLGGIFRDLGKLKEAEKSYCEAIALKPDFAKAYYSLSLLQYSEKNKRWEKLLFSKSILKNKSKKDQIDIYFARANILHKQKNYKASAEYLKKANKLQLILNPSKADYLKKKSQLLLLELNKKETNKKEYEEVPESIFIVGMPRSGSTLLESILTMNCNVNDLGETNILEESFLEQKKVNQLFRLAEAYFKKINDLKKESNITTNKNLYNYQFAGFIAHQIPNAKIIHCFRNPLDNILSIYRTQFAKGNQYSSSLVDSTNVYLDQEEIMTEYKNRFRSKIYDLNYDSLVINPNKEIKALINWLGWEWNNSYLSPHINPRSVSTASSVEVRSPINSKSIGGWKNYKEMLKPAIEILTQTDKYQDIIS